MHCDILHSFHVQIISNTEWGIIDFMHLKFGVPVIQDYVEIRSYLNHIHDKNKVYLVSFCLLSCVCVCVFLCFMTLTVMMYLLNCR